MAQVNSIVPLSVLSASSFENYSSMISLGSGASIKDYKQSGTLKNLYWVMIFERTTLQPVVNITFSENDKVPAEILKYAEDETKFIVVCFHNVYSNNLPQGAWAEFLYHEGATTQLTEIEQIFESFNCSNFGMLGYVFVAILGDSKTDVYDVGSTKLSTLLLISLQNFGTSSYSPTSIALPNSSLDFFTPIK